MATSSASSTKAQQQALAILREAQGQLNAVGADYYHVKKVIGKGSYGIVLQADDVRTGTTVAIKKVTPDIFKDAFLAYRILREIWMLAHFRHHPNVMGLRDMVKLPGPDFDCLFIVMDLMDHDLKNVLRSGQPLTEQHAQYFIYQILCGLHYIHKAGVIHRDITPANILVNANCDLKICDFGLAKSEHQGVNELTDYVCMRWYRAPELVMEETNYTGQVDVWACGCIFAQLCNPGYRPLFPGEDRIKQLGTILEVIGTPSEEDMHGVGSQMARRYIRKHHNNLPGIRFADKLRTPEGSPLSAEALDLVQGMLTFNPHKRITVAEAMRHPYLSAFYDPEDEQFPVPTFNMDEVCAPDAKLDDPAVVKSLIYNTVGRIRRMLEEPQAEEAAPLTRSSSYRSQSNSTATVTTDPSMTSNASTGQASTTEASPATAPGPGPTTPGRPLGPASPISRLEVSSAPVGGAGGSGAGPSGSGGASADSLAENEPPKNELLSEGDWSEATEGADLDEDDVEDPSTGDSAMAAAQAPVPSAAVHYAADYIDHHQAQGFTLSDSPFTNSSVLAASQQSQATPSTGPIGPERV